MSERLDKKKKRLAARKFRIRKKIKGVPERPRVSVFFSNSSIIAQVIDDESGKTLAAVSTGQKDAAEKGRNRKAAKWVGEAVAEKALEKGISKVVYDRNGRLYHGKVKELAEAMRSKGLLL